MGYLIYEGGCKFENVSPHDRGKGEEGREGGMGKREGGSCEKYIAVDAQGCRPQKIMGENTLVFLPQTYTQQSQSSPTLFLKQLLHQSHPYRGCGESRKGETKNLPPFPFPSLPPTTIIVRSPPRFCLAKFRLDGTPHQVTNPIYPTHINQLHGFAHFSS